jgi:hypothetical protein
MSIGAINGVSQSTQPMDQPLAITPAAAVTPFGHQLDAQSGEATVARGHHHDHGGASQSVTSSPASAASVAGLAPHGSTASSLLNLLT